MTRLLLLLLALSAFSLLQAQDFENYEPLQCSGKIPPDFLSASSEKFEEAKTQIDEGADKNTRKTQEQFYLTSNFVLDRLLVSGRVLFNDPMGAYVNLSLIHI